MFKHLISKHRFQEALDLYTTEILKFANDIYDDVPDAMFRSNGRISDVIVHFLLHKINKADEYPVDEYTVKINSFRDSVTNDPRFVLRNMSYFVENIVRSYKSRHLFHEKSNEFTLLLIFKHVGDLMSRDLVGGSRPEEEAAALKEGVSAEELRLRLKTVFEERNKCLEDLNALKRHAVEMPRLQFSELSSAQRADFLSNKLELATATLLEKEQLISELNAGMVELSSRHEHSVNRSSVANDLLEQELKSRSTQLESKTGECQELVEKLRRCREKVGAAETDAANDRATIERLTREVSEQKQLFEVEKSRDRGNRAKMEGLRTEAAALKGSLEASRKASEERAENREGWYESQMASDHEVRLREIADAEALVAKLRSANSEMDEGRIAAETANDALRKDLEEAKAENRRMSEQVDANKRELESAGIRYHALQQRCSGLEEAGSQCVVRQQSDSLALQQALESAGRETERLRAVYETDALDLQEKLDLTAAELRNCENAILQRENERLELATRLHSADEQLAALRQNCEAQLSAVRAECDTRLTETGAALQGATDELAVAQNELIDCRDRMLQLTNSERKKYEAKLSEVRTDCETQLAEAGAELQREIDKLVADGQKERLKLTEQLHWTEDELKSSEAKLLDVGSEYETQLSEARAAHKGALQVVTDELAVTKNGMLYLKGQVLKLSDELLASEHELKGCETRLSEDWTAREAALEAAREDLDKRLITAEEELSTRRTQTQQLTEQLDAANTQLSEYQASYQELTTNFDTVQKELSTHGGRAEQLTEELNAANFRLSEAEAAREGLLARLTLMEKEPQTLRDDLNAARDRLKGCEADLSRARSMSEDQARDWAAELSSAKEKLSAHRDQAQRSSEQLKQSSEQLIAANDRLNDCEVRLSGQSTTVEKLSVDISALKTEARELTDQLRSAEERSSQLEDVCSIRDGKMLDLVAKLKSAEEKCEKSVALYSKERSILEVRVRDLQELNERVRSEANQSVSDVEKENAVLLLQINSSREMVDDCTKKIAACEALLSELRFEKETTEKRLKATIERLQKELNKKMADEEREESLRADDESQPCPSREIQLGEPPPSQAERDLVACRRDLVMATAELKRSRSEMDCQASEHDRERRKAAAGFRTKLENSDKERSKLFAAKEVLMSEQLETIRQIQRVVTGFGCVDLEALSVWLAEIRSLTGRAALPPPDGSGLMGYVKMVCALANAVFSSTGIAAEQVSAGVVEFGQYVGGLLNLVVEDRERLQFTPTAIVAAGLRAASYLQILGEDDLAKLTGALDASSKAIVRDFEPEQTRLNFLADLVTFCGHLLGNESMRDVKYLTRAMKNNELGRLLEAHRLNTLADLRARLSDREHPERRAPDAPPIDAAESGGVVGATGVLDEPSMPMDATPSPSTTADTTAGDLLHLLTRSDTNWTEQLVDDSFSLLSDWKQDYVRRFLNMIYQDYLRSDLKEAGSMSGLNRKMGEMRRAMALANVIRVPMAQTFGDEDDAARRVVHLISLMTAFSQNFGYDVREMGVDDVLKVASDLNLCSRFQREARVEIQKLYDYARSLNGSPVDAGAARETDAVRQISVVAGVLANPYSFDESTNLFVVVERDDPRRCTEFVVGLAKELGVFEGAAVDNLPLPCSSILTRVFNTVGNVVKVDMRVAERKMRDLSRSLLDSPTSVESGILQAYSFASYLWDACISDRRVVTTDFASLQDHLVLLAKRKYEEFFALLGGEAEALGVRFLSSDSLGESFLKIKSVMQHAVKRRRRIENETYFKVAKGIDAAMSGGAVEISFGELTDYAERVPYSVIEMMHSSKYAAAVFFEIVWPDAVRTFESYVKDKSSRQKYASKIRANVQGISDLHDLMSFGIRRKIVRTDATLAVEAAALASERDGVEALVVDSD